MKRNAVVALLALPALLVLTACTDRTPPEEQVRAFIDEIETLVEERQYLELVERISNDYSDSRGNDRLKIAGILRAYFLRNKNINLIIRIGDITFPGRDFAQTSIDVFMVGRSMSEDDVFRLPKSDFEHFDLDLVRDNDDWRVARAEWTASQRSSGF